MKVGPKRKMGLLGNVKKITIMINNGDTTHHAESESAI